MLVRFILLFLLQCLFCHLSCFYKQPCQRKALLPAVSQHTAYSSAGRGYVAAACSPKQCLLVALKVTWPDQATSSSRLRSTHTIYAMHQPAAAAVIFSWWTFFNNPSSVQERALSTVLVADSPNSLDEEG